jgi:HPt (histidine-containing phosphotransfer) domain-containing protein
MEEHATSTNQSPPAHSAREEEPVVSRAVLRQRTKDLGEDGIRNPVLADLVAVFLEDASEAVPVLRRHAEASRLEEVETVAHRLKGGGATVGAEAFAAACRTVEQAAREGKEQVIQEVVDRLPALLEKTQAEFRAVMGGPGESEDARSVSST